LPKIVQAHVALFLVALIYAANYTIAKDVMGQGYLAPLPFILLRVVTGTTLFWLVQRIYVRENVLRKDLPRLMACGLFGVAINQAFFFKGLHWTTPINAALIMTTTPILVLIASSIYIGEQITAKKIVGIILGAVGAGVLIVNGQKFSIASEGWKGDLMIFINAASYGIYLVIVKKLLLRYHPITVITWVFTFGLMFIFPIAIKGMLAVNWQSFTGTIWIAVAYVLLFTTFFAYLFNSYALSIVNPSIVSIYIYLQPLLATLIALWVGSDQLNSAKVAAACLIFVGVYLVSFSKRRKTKS
jgi:drug/metabolite transporter (DMT)-like permease